MSKDTNDDAKEVAIFLSKLLDVINEQLIKHNYPLADLTLLVEPEGFGIELPIMVSTLDGPERAAITCQRAADGYRNPDESITTLRNFDE